MKIYQQLIIICLFIFGEAQSRSTEQMLERMLDITAHRTGKKDDKYKQLKKIIYKKHPVASDVKQKNRGDILFERSNRLVGGATVHIQQFCVSAQSGLSCGFHAAYNMTRFMAGNTWPDGEIERAMDKCKKILKEEYQKKNDKKRYDCLDVLVKAEKKGKNQKLREEISPILTKLAEDREATLSRLDILNNLNDEEIQIVVEELVAKDLQENVTIVGNEDTLNLFLGFDENGEKVDDPYKLIDVLYGQGKRDRILQKFNDEKGPVYFLVNTGASGTHGYGHWLPFKFELKNDVIWVTIANSLGNLDETDNPIIDRICTFLIQK